MPSRTSFALVAMVPFRCRDTSIDDAEWLAHPPNEPSLVRSDWHRSALARSSKANSGCLPGVGFNREASSPSRRSFALDSALPPIHSHSAFVSRRRPRSWSLRKASRQ